MPPKKKKKADVAIAPGGIAFVCDPHIDNHPRFGGPMVNGINLRGRQTLDTFAWAIARARALKCAALVVPGDLFHRSKPDPMLMAEVQRIILKNADQELGIVLIPGNHDMLDATAEGGNTAMAPLWDYATIVDKPAWYPIGKFQLLAIPFDARGHMSKTLDDVLGSARSLEGYQDEGIHVMATHVGVWDAEGAAPWQARAKDGMNAGDLLAALNRAVIPWAFVGNYHKHATWEDQDQAIVQVGTLCPHKADDEGLKERGLMAVLAPVAEGVNAHSHSVEIPGPRFIDTTATKLASIKKPPKGYTYYVRQLGGDPPTADAEARGWASLTYKPPDQDVAAGPSDEKKQKMGIEEAITAGIRAHKSLDDDEDRTQATELALDTWRKTSAGAA